MISSTNKVIIRSPNKNISLVLLKSTKKWSIYVLNLTLGKNCKFRKFRDKATKKNFGQ